LPERFLLKHGGQYSFAGVFCFIAGGLWFFSRVKVVLAGEQFGLQHTKNRYSIDEKMFNVFRLGTATLPWFFTRRTYYLISSMSKFVKRQRVLISSSISYNTSLVVNFNR